MPWRSKTQQSQWQKEHPDITIRNAQSYRDRLRAEMIEAYGGECVFCGMRDPIVLTIDHIQNDGAAEKRRTNDKGGVHTYSRLRREGWSKDRYQLLCQNCNCKKEFLLRRKNRKTNAVDSKAT